MCHSLMKVLDHLMLRVCVDVEPIVEEIDRNDRVLAQEVNLVRYLGFRKIIYILMKRVRIFAKKRISSQVNRT